MSSSGRDADADPSEGRVFEDGDPEADELEEELDELEADELEYDVFSTNGAEKVFSFWLQEQAELNDSALIIFPW